MEDPPTRVPAELGGGGPITQPGLAGHRVQISKRWGGAGPPPGEEQGTPACLSRSMTPIGDFPSSSPAKKPPTTTGRRVVPLGGAV